ncbi:MAG: pseudouridine-5'-phosphate glycosidase [Xanthomonadales bacterium]|nr:pseudouridine-5'-phosphate glycosidase [Xanthomonadales bacterium]
MGPAVRRALDQGRPVVALESTIITHGMPYPANLETARAAEAAVRSAGAEPATIAVLSGQPTIGLDETGLESLARAAGAARKCSLRDLALAQVDGATGGTTVAATLHLAHLAGIGVFATGGIGGVHRGAGLNGDVSADLPALATTPLTVVCAGPKAILDLGLTLEWLETHAVPVLGYGTDELPAFWSRSSGHPVDARVDDPESVARLVRAQRGLGLRASILVCQPAPESVALPAASVQQPIDQALAEAEARGIRGKALTPFLLARVLEATGGDSLAVNQALMNANAALAGRIAVALRATRAPGASC